MKQKRVRVVSTGNGGTTLEEYYFDHGPRCATRHSRMVFSKGKVTRKNQQSRTIGSLRTRDLTTTDLLDLLYKKGQGH